MNRSLLDLDGCCAARGVQNLRKTQVPHNHRQKLNGRAKWKSFPSLMSLDNRQIPVSVKRERDRDALESLLDHLLVPISAHVQRRA